MFVQGSQTCAFAMIYTSIETTPNVCTGKPKVLCRVPIDVSIEGVNRCKFTFMASLYKQKNLKSRNFNSEA